MKRLTAYVRCEYKLADVATIGISFNHISSEKGVASLTEGAASDIRYWRYPEISRDVLSLIGEYVFSEDIIVKTVLWYDKFYQQIDSYTDLSYTALSEYEKDDDATFGSRITINYSISDGQKIIFAFNGYQSKHVVETGFRPVRESFSGALNKFKVNPELQAETGIINEAGVRFYKDDFAIELTGFASFYDNLIDQIRLTEAEDSLKRKMRVNFAEAAISGVEALFRYNQANSFSIEGYLTYMYSSGENNGKKLEHLEYKPEFMGLLNLAYKFNFGFSPILEIEYTGRQWGTDAEGDYRQLNDYVFLNLRFSYQFFIENTFTEIYLRCNNLLDEFSVSKIGLPNPGRMLHGGLIVRI